MTQEFQEHWLSAYLDDELSPKERALVEQRLQDDSGARQILEDLKRVRGLVATLPQWQGDFKFDPSNLNAPAGDDDEPLDAPGELPTSAPPHRLSLTRPDAKRNSGDGYGSWRAILAMAASGILVLLAGAYLWNQYGQTPLALRYDNAPAGGGMAGEEGMMGGAEFSAPAPMAAENVPIDALERGNQNVLAEQPMLAQQSQLSARGMQESEDKFAKGFTLPPADVDRLSQSAPALGLPGQPGAPAELNAAAAPSLPSTSSLPAEPSMAADAKAATELGFDPKPSGGASGAELESMKSSAPLFICARSNAWSDQEVQSSWKEVEQFVPPPNQTELGLSLRKSGAKEQIDAASVGRGVDDSQLSTMSTVESTMETKLAMPSEMKSAVRGRTPETTAPIITGLVSDASAGNWYQDVQQVQPLIELPNLMQAQPENRYYLMPREAAVAEQNNNPQQPKGTMVLFVTQAEAEKILAVVQKPAADQPPRFWRIVPADSNQKAESSPDEKVILILNQLR